MKKLTHSEYASLLDKIGQITKFFVKKIPEINYNPVFYEALEEVESGKEVSITDKDYVYLTPCRFIDRNKETLYLVKNYYGDNFDDQIVYYLSVDYNKRIKMYINYNQLLDNNNFIEPIEFEVLDSYNKKECGDIYGNGKVISEDECGYKGRIFQKGNKAIIEYGKYNYENVTVIYPDEKYESNPSYPTYESLDKKIIAIDVPEEILTRKGNKRVR